MNLEKLVPVGASAIKTMAVTTEFTVGHWVPGMPPVFGTPFMIYLMEVAAADAIRPFIPEGWVTVGAQVNVTHLAATPAGMTVTAKAVVLSAQGRSVTLSVEAHDGIERIGEGTHVRGVVNLEKFDVRWRAKVATALKMPPG